jgi:hypothetical protein
MLPPPGDAADPWYCGCRDHRSKRDVRLRLECMWRAYQPFCPDTHFLEDARAHFVSRSWEMYLAIALLRNGFGLQKPPPTGPDLLTTIEHTRMWVEAVAGLEGEGPDRVPNRDARGDRKGSMWQGHPPSDEVLILRCAAALSAKLAKLQAYQAAGVVDRTDACIVAVTLGGILDADVASPELPIGVKGRLRSRGTGDEGTDRKW